MIKSGTFDMGFNPVDLSDGYMVSIEKYNINILKIDDMEEVGKVFNRLVKALRKSHEDLKNGYLGIYQRLDGSWDFDFSVKVDSAYKALRLGRKNNQESIWDNKNKVVIYC